MPARVWKNFKDVVGDCSFATHLSDDHLDDYRDSKERSVAVTHIVAHQTGATWLAKQLKANPSLSGKALTDKCLQWILQYYWTKGSRPEGSTSSHYFIWWDGRIFQLTDDHLRVPHVGVSPGERASYLDGSWAKGARAMGQGKEGLLKPISERALREWRAAWPKYKSPQHLFPTRYINDCSVGVEMAPCVSNGRVLAEPFAEGMRFTLAQHVSFALLTWDVAQRWSWSGDWLVDPKGGPWSPRVAGHSDFDLYGRSTAAAGMWDPGGHRSQPWWDWRFVYGTLRAMQIAKPALNMTTAALDELGNLARALKIVGKANVA